MNNCWRRPRQSWIEPRVCKEEAHMESKEDANAVKAVRAVIGALNPFDVLLV